MSLRARLATGLALLTLAAGATTLSSGAFTATSANPSSTFTADAAFPSACTPGSANAVADIDTTVRSAGAAPSGNDTFLTVGPTTAGGDRVARTFVRFPLPAIPSGCSFATAALKLTATQATTGRTINVHQVTGSWTEATTWPGPAFGATILAQASSALGTVSWTVTSTVQGLYGGAPNNGFLVKDNAEGFTPSGNRTQVYASSEAATPAQRPTLVVTYQ
jgi:large repetitive protein